MKKSLFSLRIVKNGEFIHTYLNQDKIPFAVWQGGAITTDELSDTLRAAASYISNSLSPSFMFLYELTKLNANHLLEIIEKYHISAEDAQILANYAGLQIGKGAL